VDIFCRVCELSFSELCEQSLQFDSCTQGKTQTRWTEEVLPNTKHEAVQPRQIHLIESRSSSPAPESCISQYPSIVRVSPQSKESNRVMMRLERSISLPFLLILKVPRARLPDAMLSSFHHLKFQLGHIRR